MLFTSSQMKSLHYDQCLFYLIYIKCIYEFVVSLRRNKTNPHHRNKFIPVLNTTRLQAFKPKLITYDQSLSIDQQYVSIYDFAYVETFSTAFTSMPFVMFSYMQIVRFHVMLMYITFLFES